MAKVEVVGPTKYSKEIVSRAIGKAVELRIADLDQSIEKLRTAIKSFEAKYLMETRAFLKRYAAGELEENLDYMEWIACKEILEDLEREKEMLIEIKR